MITCFRSSNTFAAGTNLVFAFVDLVHGTPQEHLRVHPEARELTSSMPRKEPQLLEPPVVPDTLA